MIKKLAPYTKGYRLLMLFAIACSAGEAVLELTLPQVMSDIVDIGIANGDRGYILMAGLKMYDDNLDEAIKLASAAASLSITKMGAQSHATLSEVLKLLGKK